MPKGFVYILSNAAMPGIVKVGFTLKVPTERAAELSTTGVPTPFEVEYYCLVQDPAGLEAKVHAALSASRHSTDREFFWMSAMDAALEVAKHAGEVEHAWSRVPLVRPRPARVKCSTCGASYVAAVYCPKCRVKLHW